MFRAIYKCRLCGKEFADSHYIESEDTTSIVAAALTREESVKTMSYRHGFRRYKVHICEDASIGFADFMGFKEAEEQKNE